MAMTGETGTRTRARTGTGLLGAGETLLGVARRHDGCRGLIGVGVAKRKAGEISDGGPGRPA